MARVGTITAVVSVMRVHSGSRSLSSGTSRLHDTHRGHRGVCGGSAEGSWQCQTAASTDRERVVDELESCVRVLVQRFAMPTLYTAALRTWY